MKAIVVGSGKSAKGFIAPHGITIFAVNGVIDWINRADYWFSLDDSKENIQRATNRRVDTTYFTAGWKCPVDKVVNYERIAASQDNEPLNKHSPEWWLWRWSAVMGINKSVGKINTGNSAWGALQLAYQLGFRDIAIIGVDGSQDERIEGGKPRDLSHLPLLFHSIGDDVKLTNLGYLHGFGRKTLQEWLDDDDMHGI